MIQEIEDSLIPKGTVDLIGVGRLGLRTAINLIQIHRGGPKIISLFDNQKISKSDLIFLFNGGKIGEYKTDFIKSLSTHEESYRNVVSNPVNITDNNLEDAIKGDVVVLELAGGDTINTAAKIIKKAHENGSKTIGTAGIFGIGEEEIVVKDISEFDNTNIVVNLLREKGIEKNHTVVSTNKFITSGVPITPYVLDDVSNIITREIIKLLL
ncbi:MAG: ThiF family adenylyltransferase [Methanobrevibacter sp.]|jgi:predicted ThiF/HesA family dinucleotide-utilizing enzyme|nr:ThiF family adenylyltransferase [Methanobrevibacter sp.]